jgi:hypothetical protein
MKKIPTLYRRDPDGLRCLTRERHPDTLWVDEDCSVATRKYDGTCLMLDDESTWWARREVKPGKTPPPGFQVAEVDRTTGRTVGWEPIDQSPFVKAWQDAQRNQESRSFTPGTYELIGPKVNGNPEKRERHELIKHAEAERIDGVPVEYDDLRDWLAEFPGEGIVWHHPDGRMTKIKRRDFGS